MDFTGRLIIYNFLLEPIIRQRLLWTIFTAKSDVTNRSSCTPTALPKYWDRRLCSGARAKKKVQESPPPLTQILRTGGESGIGHGFVMRAKRVKMCHVPPPPSPSEQVPYAYGIVQYNINWLNKGSVKMLESCNVWKENVQVCRMSLLPLYHFRNHGNNI